MRRIVITNKIIELFGIHKNKNQILYDVKTVEHDKLSKEFEKTQNEISEVETKISEKNDKKKSIELYESELKKAPKKITEFDNVLFAMLVDKIIVHKDKNLEMVWKGNV